jgi:hypothetical protein
MCQSYIFKRSARSAASHCARTGVTAAAAAAAATRDGIHQYFYNFSIFFLSFFLIASKLLLTPPGHHLT